MSCALLRPSPHSRAIFSPLTIASVATVTEYICHLPRMSHTQSINPQERNSWLKDMIWAFLILIVTAKTLFGNDWLWQFMSLLPMLELLSFFKKKFLLLSLWIYYLCMTPISTILAISKTDKLFNMLKGHLCFCLEPVCSSFAVLSQCFLFKKKKKEENLRNKTKMYPQWN